MSLDAIFVFLFDLFPFAKSFCHSFTSFPVKALASELHVCDLFVAVYSTRSFMTRSSRRSAKQGCSAKAWKKRKSGSTRKKKNNLSVYYKIIDSKREFKEKQRCALLKGGNVLIYETEQCEKKMDTAWETEVQKLECTTRRHRLFIFLVWASASNVLDQLRQ